MEITYHHTRQFAWADIAYKVWSSGDYVGIVARRDGLWFAFDENGVLAPASSLRTGVATRKAAALLLPWLQ